MWRNLPAGQIILAVHEWGIAIRVIQIIYVYMMCICYMPVCKYTSAILKEAKTHVDNSTASDTKTSDCMSAYDTPTIWHDNLHQVGMTIWCTHNGRPIV